MTPIDTLWKVDNAASDISFKVKHLVVATIPGHFSMFKAEMRAADLDRFLDAKFEVLIDVFSIDTGETDRDEHLKSADFLHADMHPEIAVTASGLTHIEGDRYRLPAQLTIKGVTQSVVFDVLFGGEAAKDGFGNFRLEFEFKTTIGRKDFGINYSILGEGGSLVVAEDVQLYARLQFVRVMT